MQKTKGIVFLLVLATGILAAPQLAFALSPDAQNDEYSTPEDTKLTIIGSGVLDNDTDPEDDSLTAVLDSTTTNGVLVLNSDGSFEYTPDADFTGTDSFLYHANDGADDGNPATVTINVIPVNDLPQAVNDEYSTVESIPLSVSAPGVLDNDTDPENESLTAVLDSTTTNGVLTLNSDGSFEYTPDADFTGTDSFLYHANDGADDGNPATVMINVIPVNDLPQAVNDEYSTVESIPLSVSAPGVLDNDTDPEDDSLTAVLDSTTTNGVLVLNSDGSFEYTPDADFTGTDSFSYYANDGTNDSTIATVTIQINLQDTDSLIDLILEQIQILFDKIFAVEDEVAELKEQNAALESRVAELEVKMLSVSSHSDDDDHTHDKKDKHDKKHKHDKKINKEEIKELKKEYKEKKKMLQDEYKELESELKHHDHDEA